MGIFRGRVLLDNKPVEGTAYVYSHKGDMINFSSDEFDKGKGFFETKSKPGKHVIQIEKDGKIYFSNVENVTGKEVTFNFKENK